VSGTAAAAVCDVRHFAMAMAIFILLPVTVMDRMSRPMLRTEKEAAKIGCPLLTLAFGYYQGSFREADGVCCQGSHCMLWRWGVSTRGSPETSRKGYCGLGGKPNDLPGTCEWA
jgi:hypothetical protein